MPERVKNTKYRGFCCEKNMRGMVCRRGQRRQNAGGGVLRKEIEGGYAGEVKQTKCGGFGGGG